MRYAITPTFICLHQTSKKISSLTFSKTKRNQKDLISAKSINSWLQSEIARLVGVCHRVIAIAKLLLGLSWFMLWAFFESWSWVHKDSIPQHQRHHTALVSCDIVYKCTSSFSGYNFHHCNILVFSSCYFMNYDQSATIWTLVCTELISRTTQINMVSVLRLMA